MHENLLCLSISFYKGTIIPTIFSLQVLQKNLLQALAKKRQGKAKDDAILHHDNTPAHKTMSAIMETGLLEFDLTIHLPTSPNNVPMDFKVFSS